MIQRAFENADECGRESVAMEFLGVRFDGPPIEVHLLEFMNGSLYRSCALLLEKQA